MKAKLDEVEEVIRKIKRGLKSPLLFWAGRSLALGEPRVLIRSVKLIRGYF